MPNNESFKMQTLIPQKIQHILCCPDCHNNELLLVNNKALKCKQCDKHYEIINSIPDLRPSETIRMPKIYDDPDYQKTIGFYADIKDYQYKSGGIGSYVQNSAHRIVKSFMRNKQYKLILDLGCGDGVHYPFLKFPEMCFGIDIDQKSLEKSRNNFPDFFVIRADGYSLPMRDNSVDCIINIYNLEHMVYLDLALEEMTRIISPGGDIFISVPNEGGLSWYLGREMTTMRKYNTPSLNYRRAIEIEHINCIWQLEKALKRHFDIRKKVAFPFHMPGFHFNLITTYHCVLGS